MAVYVDPMMECVPNPRWMWNENCHLTADTDAELHVFAAELGLKRSWFQVGKSGVHHYDLTRGKRAQAVRLGAVELSTHEAGVRYRAIRQGQQPPTKESPCLWS